MKPGVKRFLTQFLIIISIIVLILILSQLWLRVFTRHNQAWTVPDFTGMSIAQASEVAVNHSLRLEIIDSLFLPNKPRGSVFKQIPNAGEKVKKNRRILITINSVVPRKVKAPSLVGFSLRQAKAELASQNFQLGKLYYEEDMATNTVLAQQYQGMTLIPGTAIDAQSTIDLVLGVSPEHNIAYVPRVLGLNYEMAKDVITDNSLNVGRVLFDASVQTAADSLAAIVVRQSPEASEQIIYDMGQPVNIYLSLGSQDQASKAREEERR